MVETIELREIRVFLALAQELHFGRAAERLGVTQSRVSQSLRELELKLGDTLLHRTSRRVALTAAGERFLAEIDPAHRRLVTALRRASRSPGELEGPVRIGLLTGVSGGPRLIEIIRAFEERYPRCRVGINDVSLTDRLEALRDRSIDLMTTRLPLHQPDLVVGPVLTREPRLLGVAVDHPLSARSEVSLEDIADYRVTDVTGMLPPELVQSFFPRSTPSGRPMRFRRLEHHELGELITMIALGKIVHPTASSFADHFAHPNIRYVPIRDLPAWESALVWRRQDRRRRLRAFVEVAVAIAGPAPAPT
jgi:DNA-binding transcriptional LysR family regulator